MAMKAMGTTYEMYNARVERLRMALNAVVLPICIKLSRTMTATTRIRIEWVFGASDAPTF